jgi:hypothetical protein
MRIVVAAAASLILWLAADAQAAIELTSFSVASHSSGPGLLVQTSPSSGGPTSLALNQAGDSVELDLFKIWTAESSVNVGEDTVAKPISVAFNFTSGTETFGDVVHGQTRGVAGFFLFLPFGAGVVDWDTPLSIFFGPNQASELRIDFLDQMFNSALGFGNLAPGESRGSTLKAKFTLVSFVPGPEVEPGALSAPEPATLVMWSGLGVGLAVSGWRCRQLRSRA